MGNFKELVRVGKDAETKYTQGGKAVTVFSAAFDNGWGDNKQTIWLDCKLWGERGTKVAEYITKGGQVVVDGNIGTREYEGKTYITLDVQDVKLVAKPKDSGNGTPRQNAQRPQRRDPEPMPDLDDPIPFITNRSRY